MKPEESKQVIDEALFKLKEYFSAVQILATWEEDGKTFSRHVGVGNLYSRLGLAHEFIDQDIAYEHAKALSEKLNPPDDSGIPKEP